MTSLAQRLESDGYDGYVYSYPHKTAYRPLDPPVPLQTAWRQEDTSNLFLYVHLPFCEMRCGFCNLFTTIRPGQDLVEATLSAIERQSAQVSQELSPIKVSQAAIGGGTPSFLTLRQIERLFTSLASHWPVQWGDIPLSFESSPATLSPEKLALLKSLGVKRLSLGVQSFLSEDLAALRRPELGVNLDEVCEMIKTTEFPTFNLDLIYGIPGQDEEQWSRNLEAALRWSPEELYLYPLYVGKLTNLDRLGGKPGSSRRALYLQARERLLEAGYRQLSMRHFRRIGAPEMEADYCCQRDGMVGLGPGARSYTRELHYSSEYAVGQPGVRAIIGAFAQTESYRDITYGAWLNLEEQRRRFVLKSLFRSEGLDSSAYRAQFGSEVENDLPMLRELLELGLAEIDLPFWKLTEEGMAYSDTIGPWLYSEAVQQTMALYEFA